MRTIWLLALSLWMVVALPADAERELYWRAIDVEARLDADGVLHVIEQQTMVMTGDWNGGERSFRLHPGQSLDLLGIARIDAETGLPWPLARGDLSRVDHYDWAGARAVRWRSRAPDAPSFDHTELTYRLTYELGEVVRARGDSYWLDHDFAFTDRAGVVERFSLDLVLDPAWTATPPIPRRHQSRADLQPGEGYEIRAELAHAGPQAPSSVRRPKPAWPVVVIWLAGLAAMAALYRRFVAVEEPLGRFAPVPAMPDGDTAWLEQHVLRWQPEEVGALWDQQVGPPEVAAVLARLVAEGKLESKVERRGLGRRKVLVLTRKVELGELSGHVGKLMSKLFFGRRRTVDTDAIRSHYKRSGFDPAGILRPGLEREIGVKKDQRKPLPRIARLWPLWLAAPLLIALDLVVRHEEVFIHLGGDTSEANLLWVILTFFAAMIGLAIGLGVAVAVRRRVASAGRLAAFLPLFAGLGFSLVMALQVWSRQRQWVGMTAGLLGLLGLTVLALALLASWLQVARSRLDREGIALRRPLLAARRWFEAELSRATPRLEDAWFPYLVAFGLGPQVDGWFRAFGGAASAASVSSSSFGSSISSSGAASWSGGGGAFGGAGATVAWTAAATGMAAGVSAASSSGSSGGGGGGGSSGGGGGGGW